MNSGTLEGLGVQSFTWFIGVIENRQDPLELGRCKVRCLGWHTEDKTKLPTDDLPWSHVVMPLNYGTNIHIPVEGTWVVGFFKDGQAAQEPIIMGILPGIPESASLGGGFEDPREVDGTLTNAPQTIASITQNLDGSGASIANNDPQTYPAVLLQPDSSKLARNANSAIHAYRANNVIEGITEAGRLADSGTTWNEKSTPYASVYPYNQVYESESGHALEFDDTKDAERVALHHRAGTFLEIHPDGSRVNKIVSNNYTIVLKNDHVAIYGNQDVFINGNATFYVDGTVDEQITGDKNTFIEGDWNVKIDGNNSIDIQGWQEIDVDKERRDTVHQSIFTKVGKDLTEDVGHDKIVQVVNHLDIDANRVDIN